MRRSEFKFQNNRKGITPPLLLGAIVAVALTATVVMWLRSLPHRGPLNNYSRSDVSGSLTTLYTNQYPANLKFQEELAQLRQSGQIKPENENLIQRAILASSEQLKMPPALLWCLLFRESRLNHLEGLEGEQGARGLGQFSYYSFYEINHHLQRYSSDNYRAMIALLGRDVRPVEPRQTDLYHPSSYFFIPTAVMTSAAYLNNRYWQLARVLEAKRIVYDPDLLWLYAAMAYNKGTRTILAFWDDARRTGGGTTAVSSLVLEKASFFRSVSDTTRWVRALKTIWPTAEAAAYAKEIKNHMELMRDCSVAMEEQMRLERVIRQLERDTQKF